MRYLKSWKLFEFKETESNTLDLDTIDDILLDVTDNQELTSMSFKDYDDNPNTKDMVVIIIKRNEGGDNYEEDEYSASLTEDGKESIKRLIDYISQSGYQYKMEIGTDNIPPGFSLDGYDNYVREFKYEELEDDVELWRDEYIRIEVYKQLS